MTEVQYDQTGLKLWLQLFIKKDSKSNPTNNRPVSLTSLCCKVMEHTLQNILVANNILIDQQHGFSQRFSLVWHSTYLSNQWLGYLH